MVIQFSCSQKPESISAFKEHYLGFTFGIFKEHYLGITFQVLFLFVNYAHKYIKKLPEYIWRNTNEMSWLQY